ncbi:ATPase [Leptospira langatensis]|uniref:ATPase n=1 Tax=Leptospira langatensis TaxID=2484983 RepID=A0A5F1ZQJ1_9LEPT|nr:SRPBCC family protein [Leptospira langatensis]TGK05417.1 ATPase [Leptospira langatensis]TGL38553.1 ATPase [Leptospira langatensis]
MKAEISVVGREITGTKLYDAPREMVWDAWTDPKQVAIWWGPNGFTNTVHEMSVRPGGIWRLTMHGPDGIDYPNLIQYIEVVRPEKLVYDHGDDVNPKQFHVTVLFQEEGSKTRLTMRSIFPSEEEVRNLGDFALEGLGSTLERLRQFVEKK